MSLEGSRFSLLWITKGYLEKTQSKQLVLANEEDLGLVLVLMSLAQKFPGFKWTYRMDSQDVPAWISLSEILAWLPGSLDFKKPPKSQV